MPFFSRASAEPTAMRAPRYAKSLQYKSGAVQRWAAMRLLEFMLIFELVALRILVIGTTVRLCTPCAHPCHICTGTGRTAAKPALRRRHRACTNRRVRASRHT